VKTSVTGFSRLVYILDMAKYCRNRNQVKGKELLEVVLKTAEELEEDWMIKVGKRPGKKAGNIARTCVEALTKWGVLSKVQTGLAIEETTYTPSKKLRIIGELVANGREEEAKHHLLDVVLTGGEEPFYPSRLWVPIRDYRIKIIQVMFGCRKTGEDGKKHIKTVPGPTISFKEAEGIAYDDGIFVRDRVNTNFRAFDIMCGKGGWGEFFGIINNFPLETSVLESRLTREQITEARKKYSCSTIVVKRPALGVYLTVLLASFDELKRALLILEKNQSLSLEELALNLDKSTHAVECITNILYRLNLISKEGTKWKRSHEGEITFRELFERSKGKSVVISDSPRAMGVRKEFHPDLDPKRCYVLMKAPMSLSIFEETVTEIYGKLVRDRFGYPVWIGDLQNSVCRVLRITKDVFQNFLLKLHEKGTVNLHKAPILDERIAYKRLPIIHQGRAYYQVSIY